MVGHQRSFMLLRRADSFFSPHAMIVDFHRVKLDGSVFFFSLSSHFLREAEVPKSVDGAYPPPLRSAAKPVSHSVQTAAPPFPYAYRSTMPGTHCSAHNNIL